jgi:hypothetical protein
MQSSYVLRWLHPSFSVCPDPVNNPTGLNDSSSMPFQPPAKRANFALPQNSGVAMPIRIKFLFALALPALFG